MYTCGIGLYTCGIGLRTCDLGSYKHGLHRYTSGLGLYTRALGVFKYRRGSYTPALGAYTRGLGSHKRGLDWCARAQLVYVRIRLPYVRARLEQKPFGAAHGVRFPKRNYFSFKANKLVGGVALSASIAPWCVAHCTWFIVAHCRKSQAQLTSAPHAFAFANKQTKKLLLPGEKFHPPTHCFLKKTHRSTLKNQRSPAQKGTVNISCL